MTSCCIVVCVWSACVYLFKRSFCDMQAVARSSELWPKEKRSIWMVVFLLWPKPSTASTLHPGVFYSVSSHSSTFTSLCPKPHSWPNMARSHQSEAFRYFSDGSREEEEPILLLTVSGCRGLQIDVIRVLWGTSRLFFVWFEATGPVLSQPSPWAEPT